MSTAEVWAQDWGNSYTARNRVDWRARVPFWRDVLDLTGARSVYEVGSNAGWNLSAIQRIDPFVRLHGCEVNAQAHAQATHCGLGVRLGGAVERLAGESRHYDVVYTAGVLIHIAPAELKATMEAIAQASADYVLAVEYAADEEEEVLYRGQSGMLWRRPYGKLYQDMGLQLVKEWDAGPGFDRCTAWLLRKAPP